MVAKASVRATKKTPAKSAVPLPHLPPLKPVSSEPPAEALIAIISEEMRAGFQLAPRDDGDAIAFIRGVQLVRSVLTRRAFEASGLGDLYTVEDFCSQTLAVVRRQIQYGLTIEARDYLLEQNLRADVRKELDALK